MLSEPLQGLSGLTARQLTRRLREYVREAGCPVSGNELALIRELLRRARRAEAAQLQLWQGQGPRLAPA